MEEEEEEEVVVVEHRHPAAAGRPGESDKWVWQFLGRTERESPNRHHMLCWLAAISSCFFRAWNKEEIKECSAYYSHLFMNLMDNVVQLRKLQLWIWANKRWEIWQKTNICGEKFTVKHWTIITLNLETFCGGEIGVFSAILSSPTSQTDRRESWERLNGGNLGIWAGQGREGTAVSEELNHLSGPAHQRSGCLMQRGTLGSWSWYEIDLITPRISISLLSSTARGLPTHWTDLGRY